jgi:hypothetical protein
MVFKSNLQSIFTVETIFLPMKNIVSENFPFWHEWAYQPFTSPQSRWKSPCKPSLADQIKVIWRIKVVVILDIQTDAVQTIHLFLLCLYNQGTVWSSNTKLAAKFQRRPSSPLNFLNGWSSNRHSVIQQQQEIMDISSANQIWTSSPSLPSPQHSSLLLRPTKP